ncbi:MAG: TonB-dependent siderophore receptor [Janthinobacterium lividum]
MTSATLAPVSVVGNRTASGFAPADVRTGPYKGLDALDVPATVNVVTREVMDAQGDAGLFDALRNVAGVTRQQLNGVAYDQLAIRGIALDNRSSYYLDGVLPIDNNIWMPMQDKERVEVLKGASALYYGFAVPAGIVNMVMKRAGATPVTRISLLADSHGSVGVHADIARRFGANEQFGLRVNAVAQHVETPITGDRGYRKMQSVAFDWRVNRQLTLQYDLEHIEQRVVEQAGIVPLTAKNGVITLPALPSASKLLSPNGYPTQASATSQLLRADYLLSDNWSASISVGQSITRRDRWLWIFQKYNVTTGAGTLQGSKQNGQMYENKNVRAEINGAFKTGPIAHDVTFGVVQNWLFQPDFTTYYYTAAQNLYNPVDVTSIKATGTSKAFYAQHVSNRGYYVFDRIDLTPRWQFVPGLRRSAYRTTQAGSATYDTSKTTPSGSLVFKVTPRTSLYASYIEGLESSGTAPATASNAYQILPAAVSRQEEVGIRHRFADDTLASIGLFNLKQASAGTNADNVYAVNGNARYRGVEFSLQGNLGRDLAIVASGMLLNAQIIDSADATLRGKTPENTPHVTANLFASYRVAPVPGLSINGGVNYTGPRPINDLDQARIGGYTLLSAGASYATRLFGKRATFQANLENLANRRYWSAAGSSQLAVGLERTLALTSTFEF